jgi:hypothetical protein
MDATNKTDDNMVIKETTVWGDVYKARGSNSYRRLFNKRLIRTSSYPFVDHVKTYAYKPKGQRGPAREEQTFLLSYTYKYDAFKDEDDEAEFIAKLDDIGLSFHKEPCIFRGKDAYKTIVYEKKCALDKILHKLNEMDL